MSCIEVLIYCPILSKFFKQLMKDIKLKTLKKMYTDFQDLRSCRNFIIKTSRCLDKNDC